MGTKFKEYERILAVIEAICTICSDYCILPRELRRIWYEQHQITWVIIVKLLGNSLLNLALYKCFTLLLLFIFEYLYNDIN